MNRRAALVALCTLVSLGFAGLDSVVSAQAPTDEALVARIDELAARSLSGPGAAGLSVAVAVGDRLILSKGYGMVDLEHGVEATDASLFRIASVTKQYTAAAIMRLVEQDRLGLDDDLTKYVDYPTHGRTVTIRQLLNHTSGITDYTVLPAPDGRTINDDLPPEKVLEAVRDLPFDFEPGTGRAYSNTGYHLLGMVIEKVSGVPYADHLQDEFFTRLGLARTRYDVNSDVIPGRARGYRLLDGRTANAAFINMSVPFAAGSLMASAGDLVAWQLALVNGEVVSRESYEQMTTRATLADGSRTEDGFGLKLHDFEGHARVMHEGGIHGFNSILEYYPEEKLSIAVLSNSESVPSSLLAREIARVALGLEDPALKDVLLPASELEPLIGKYLIQEIGLEFVVTVSDGRVFVQGTGEPPVPVMAQGGGEFRASWDASVKFVFEAPAAGGQAPSFAFEQGGERFKAVRVP